jgi:hypothetical protein
VTDNRGRESVPWIARDVDGHPPTLPDGRVKLTMPCAACGASLKRRAKSIQRIQRGNDSVLLRTELSLRKPNFSAI